MARARETLVDPIAIELLEPCSRADAGCSTLRNDAQFLLGLCKCNLNIEPRLPAVELEATPFKPPAVRVTA